MNFEFRTPTQAAAEDIFFGQEVMIWARWLVILATGVFTLWNAHTVGQLTGGTCLVVALMATNFFLHGRWLVERPVNRRMLAGVGLFDLLIVTALVVASEDGGLASPLFALYYPLLAAHAFVFPPRQAAGYAAIALGAYAVACLATIGFALVDAADLKQLVMRLITLGAMSGIGTYYWRIQRQRRDALGLAAELWSPEAERIRLGRIF